MASENYKVVSLNFSSRVDVEDAPEGSGAVKETTYLVAHVGYDYGVGCNKLSGVASGDVQTLATKDISKEGLVTAVKSTPVLDAEGLNKKVKAIIEAKIASDNLSGEYERSVDTAIRKLNRESSFNNDFSKTGLGIFEPKV